MFKVDIAVDLEGGSGNRMDVSLGIKKIKKSLKIINNPKKLSNRFKKSTFTPFYMRSKITLIDSCFVLFYA